jgi:glycosyltransferase involved in cell wall biosynthesis
MTQPVSATLIHSPAESASDEQNIEVTILMPCLNESKTVGTCIDKARRALESLGVAYEVIVADNGSSDGSPAIARQHGARVISVARRGYGSALRAGIEAARGRYVIMGDADDSYDFGQSGLFLERLREGYELVMGNRFKGGIQPGAMPWLHRYIGTPLLTGLVNLFFHGKIGDVQSGLRALRRESYYRLGLAADGMEFASEMVAKACLRGLRITEVPICLYPDGRDRPPHLRSFRDGWRNLRFLLLFCPMWLYLVPAALLLGTGLGLMIWLTPGTRWIGVVGFDVHTMLLGSLLVMLGYQNVWLWAFAKIYGWTQGLLPSDTFSSRLFRYLNLERGLLAGLSLVLVGLGANLHLVYRWYEQSFGPLNVMVTLREAIWGCLAIVLGVQTIYSSFFLSMIGMDRPKNDTPPDPNAEG